MYEYFQRLLDLRGLTSADVSRATGIGEGTLSAWKKRNSQLNYEYLKKIGDYLGVNPTYFLDGVISYPSDVEKEGQLSVEEKNIISLTKQYPVLKDMLLAGGKLMRTDEKAVEAMAYALRMMAGEV